MPQGYQIKCNAYLRIAQVVESLLVRGVCLLQVIHHEMAVAQATPSLSIARIQLQNILQVLNRFGKLLFCSKDARDRVHCRDRPLIVTQGLLIGIHRSVQIAHQFSQAAYEQYCQYLPVR